MSGFYVACSEVRRVLG